MDKAAQIVKAKMTDEQFKKLEVMNNPEMMDFIAKAVAKCNPDTIFVCSDDSKDIDYIRQKAIDEGGETPLNISGHTYHFDGPNDQGRDKGKTRYLLPKGVDLGKRIDGIDKEQGLAELEGLFTNSMKGRQMLVSFYCLGPSGSEFSIPCLQITDSGYVVHSENILYRNGYQQFKKAGSNFFRFLHSQGELENAVSKNYQDKRIYIDLFENTVYSVNTQYAGNTVGLKKLALRLAINKSDNEGWLAEHMFVMGVNGPNGRKTYFTGAFPSACGKTSTAMLPGQTIIGDDIAYFRKIDGVAKCVNVEQGIFGIIQDVNQSGDPVIYDVLQKPGEVIFGNVLVKEGKPYWLGMGQELPSEGINYIGKWQKGMKDANGNEYTASHKNARYTIRISALANKDEQLDNPKGVDIGAVVYGGRDSDTCVPVEQAFDWAEGIILKGASIESETTAATLGQEGVRTFNLMSNLDFLAIPLGKYIQNNLDFSNGLKKVPPVFSVNYFLRDKNGKYLNGMLDKKVWILWAELKANGDVEALETPLGYIPIYEDLAKLFKQALDKDYTKEQYKEQFTIRIPELLAKYDRVEKVYRDTVADTPKVVYDTFAKARQRLKDAQAKFGDYISPFDLV